MSQKHLAALFAMSLSLWGCSSADKGSEDAADLETPVDMADTDEVPADDSPDTAEVPSPDADADALAQLDSPESAPSVPSEQTPPVAFDSSGTDAGHEEYVVNGSDTLMKIAFETYGDLYQWKRIYEDNRDLIQDPNNIPRGTRLKLSRPSETVHIERNGERYLIQGGDTLGKVSNNVYGTPVKWRRIWDNNRQLIRDPNRIYAGFYLYYILTDEDKRERDELRNRPQPLAGNPDTGRNPSSVSMPSGGGMPQGLPQLPRLPTQPQAAAGK